MDDLGGNGLAQILSMGMRFSSPRAIILLQEEVHDTEYQKMNKPLEEKVICEKKIIRTHLLGNERSFDRVCAVVRSSFLSVLWGGIHKSGWPGLNWRGSDSLGAQSPALMRICSKRKGHPQPAVQPPSRRRRPQGLLSGSTMAD